MLLNLYILRAPIGVRRKVSFKVVPHFTNPSPSTQSWVKLTKKKSPLPTFHQGEKHVRDGVLDVPVHQGRGHPPHHPGPVHPGGVLCRGGEPPVQSGPAVLVPGAGRCPQEGTSRASGQSANVRADAAVHREGSDRREGGHLRQGGPRHQRNQEPDECDIEGGVHVLRVCEQGKRVESGWGGGASWDTVGI